MPADLDKRVRAAIRHFWRTRKHQQKTQGKATGRLDYGTRGAVTGGAQLDGFIKLLGDLFRENGIATPAIHIRSTTLPGYFRPTKEWDLIVVVNGELLASVEVKSQVGSFGNNFNNRVEEALGNATDLWTAYREGAFKPSQRPWLGYLMLLQDTPASTRPVRVGEPHFAAFPDFHGTSYAARYQLLCEKLVRERLYDAACLLMSDAARGVRGEYTVPSPELNFERFAASLAAHAAAFVKYRSDARR